MSLNSYNLQRFWYSQSHRDEMNQNGTVRSFAIVNGEETEFTDCYPFTTKQYPLVKDRIFLGVGIFSKLEKL